MQSSALHAMSMQCLFQGIRSLYVLASVCSWQTESNVPQVLEKGSNRFSTFLHGSLFRNVYMYTLLHAAELTILDCYKWSKKCTALHCVVYCFVLH